MVMDPGLRELSAILNGGIKFDDYLSEHDLDKALKLDPLPFIDQNVMDLNPVLDPNPTPFSGVSPAEGESPEDCEIFSDIALKYISQMLLEEDLEENFVYEESSVALKAAEKPFYDILGEKYPPSPDQHPLYVEHNVESPDGCITSSCSTYNSSSSSSNVDGSWVGDAGEYPSSQNILSVYTDYTSQSSFSSSNSGSSAVDGLEESPTNTIRIADFLSESQPVWHFRRGVEEANKFLPNSRNLVVDVDNSGFGFLPREPKEEAGVVEVKAEKKDERDDTANGSRGRKHPHREDLDLELEEGRSNKQTAVYSEETLRSEMFDMVLLCTEGKCGPTLSKLQESLQNGASKNTQSGQPKGSNGTAKTRGKKQGKKEVVDLRTILIQCAQSVAADDRRTAYELLKQIKQHSSPFGDGSQRLAHYFANGLEARLAGTGSQISIALANKKMLAADILRAYHLFLSACPFKKISHFFANQSILDVVENAPRLHIVDFGISFGFQWPCLLQRLSGRTGGPPMVRITGIDVPQPGFRPAERVEETGRRLADYAHSFNIPFEYIPIAQKWESIQVEDIKIEKDEVLVVNCLYMFKKLADETVVIDSPRNIVLNTIRKMNPDIFIHGIVNGAYSAPFFITRFREALFHWSALFDMLETNVPREHPERILIEKDLFGREAMNVIACEGAERVERPETYKQWQVRNLRAGFRQLPLNQDIMKKARDKVKSSYHKDFVIDQDSQWMLQGWKGRIIYALSTWKPDHRRCCGQHGGGKRGNARYRSMTLDVSPTGISTPLRTRILLEIVS